MNHAYTTTALALLTIAGEEQVGERLLAALREGDVRLQQIVRTFARDELGSEQDYRSVRLEVQAGAPLLACLGSRSRSLANWR